MQISAIVQGVNSKLGGDQLPYRELVPYLDSVIDDINAQMNTRFTAFSELRKNTVEYTCFPDRYIRKCVIIGAAYYYYQTDEEGGQGATSYQATYYQNLFYMVRDYLHEVPLEWQACTYNGSYPFNIDNGSCQRSKAPLCDGLVVPDDSDTDESEGGGKPVTITIGNVVALLPGSQPTVENIGTDTNIVLNFGIPSGETGPQGIPGQRGEPGATGQPGAQGEPGHDGTYITLDGITLPFIGWTAVTPAALAQLELEEGAPAPLYMYVYVDETGFIMSNCGGLAMASDPGMLYGECVFNDAQIIFYAYNMPTADVVIDRLQIWQ